MRVVMNFFLFPHRIRSMGMRKKQAQSLATKWLWTYNNERPHTAIGGVPPRQLLMVA
jgi:transposase InsO family protein